MKAADMEKTAKGKMFDNIAMSCRALSHWVCMVGFEYSGGMKAPCRSATFA